MRGRKHLRIAVHMLILLSWVFVMLQLLNKEGFLKRKTADTSFRRLIPSDLDVDVWKGIYIGDKWVGYAYTNMGPYKEGVGSGYILNSISHFRFQMFNDLKSVEISSTQILDNSYKMLRFNARITGLTDISVKGKRLGTHVMIEISYNDETYKRSFEADDDLFLENSILSIYRGKGLRVGDSYRLNIFNPLTLSAEPIEVKVVGEEEGLMALETRFAGLTSKAWVDKKGHVVREETANGWVMKVETKESIEARFKESQDKGVDILREVAVMTERGIDSPREAGFLRIRVSGIDFSNFPFDNKRQRLVDAENGIVEIKSIVPEEDSAIPVPYKGEEYKEFLAPSIWIQCRDPKIREKAAEIVGEEHNSWTASRRIGEWVHDNIEKSFTTGIPIASSVLLYRRGDCNEHTVLFLALARAAGIPCDMCAGLVYMEDAFYYHAWPKVYIGEWVHLDPTLGQLVADATHFEMVSGDIVEQARLAFALGKIKISILATEKRKENL